MLQNTSLFTKQCKILLSYLNLGIIIAKCVKYCHENPIHIINNKVKYDSVCIHSPTSII